MAVVDVDAAGVVPVAFAKDDVVQQVAFAVEHEQVADALAGGSVVAVDRLGVAHRTLEDLDRAQVDPVADDFHRLRVEGIESDRDGRGLRPRGVARDVVEGGHQCLVRAAGLGGLQGGRGGDGDGEYGGRECGAGQTEIHGGSPRLGSTRHARRGEQTAPQPRPNGGARLAWSIQNVD